MTYYSVAEIAEALGTNQGTVRRWIRSGALGAEKGSLREGNKVSEDNIRSFFDKHPKYARQALKSSLLGRIAGASLGRALIQSAIDDIGSLKVSEMDGWLASAKETLAVKEQEAAELKQEIEKLRRNIKVIEAMKVAMNMKEDS